jgi:hypothetical protein
MKKLFLAIFNYIKELIPEIDQQPRPKRYGLRKISHGKKSIPLRGQGQTKKFGSKSSYRHK